MRYWVATLIGLVVAGASIVAVDWGLYHLVRTGTCASGGPYVSARACPPGTGTHVAALVGGIFGGLFGIGIYAARGRRGRPARVGLGLAMWSLLFLTIAATVALAAFGPANNDDPGARTAAVIIGVIFIPMALAPLPFALRRPAPAARAGPVPLMRSAAPVMRRPSGPAPAAGGGDPLKQLEKLGELRARGVLTDEEFAEQKRRLLDEI